MLPDMTLVPAAADGRMVSILHGRILKGFVITDTQLKCVDAVAKQLRSQLEDYITAPLLCHRIAI